MTNSSQLSQHWTLRVTDYQDPPWYRLCLIIFSIFGIAGNGLCCYAIGRFKALRTIPNYFITSLAISDLYMCLVVMPLSIYENFNRGLWSFGNPLCYFWNMSQFVSITSSIMILGVISGDRFLSITRPTPYSKVRKPRFAVGVIAGVWLTSMLVFAIFSDTQLLRRRRCSYQPRDGVSRIFVSFIIFWIPLFVVITLNLGIACVTCQLKKVSRGPAKGTKISPEIPLSTQCPRKGMVTTVSRGDRADQPGCSKWVDPTGILPEPNHSQPPRIINVTPAVGKSKSFRSPQDDIMAARKRRSYIVIAIVIGSFTLCWSPLFFMIVHSTVCPECYQNPTAMFLWRESRWLGYFNSSINPLIYALIKRDYRRAFKSLIQRT